MYCGSPVLALKRYTDQAIISGALALSLYAKSTPKSCEKGYLLIFKYGGKALYGAPKA